MKKMKINGWRGLVALVGVVACGSAAVSELPPGGFDEAGFADFDDYEQFAACMQGPDVSYDADGTNTFDVSVGPGFNFTPADVTIEIGDTVHWFWAGGFHNVESGVDGNHDGNFWSGAPTSDTSTTFDVTFDDAFLAAQPMPDSVYPYYCVVHESLGMVGSVTAEANPCMVFDFDDDGDVDLVDFAEFGLAFTGG